MQTVPMLRPEVLNSAHVSCLEMEKLWAPCEDHVLKLAARSPLKPLLLHDSRQGWWEFLSEQCGSRSLGDSSPLQRLLPPRELGISYHLFSPAPNLFYSYPRLQRAFYDLFHNAFPKCFGERAESPIYDRVHSHHSIKEYSQLEGTPRITGPTLGTAKDGKYLMWSNLDSASATQPGL